MNAFLHPDAFEEMNWNPQSELQNCLAEALPWAVERRGPIETTGDGEIIVEIRTPVYCRATDAFAGMMLAARHRVKTPEEAGDWVTVNWPSTGDDYDPQVNVIVPEYMRGPITAFPVPVEDAEIPF